MRAIPPRAGLPYKTEMLFEHFRMKCYANNPPKNGNVRQADFQTGATWRELIRKHLYANTPAKLSKAIEGHPYFKQLLPLIRNSALTVTYNFDDLIEQALVTEQKTETRGSKGFESVTNPWTQFRRKDAVIYHPNGVVPQSPLETPSDRFVFSEASYVKQLLGIFSGDQAGLISHLSKNTCLFIGLSLEDDTVRNVLTQAAQSCPGNYHYYVHFVSSGSSLDKYKQTREAIRLANFKVYNLVTLFLEEDEIRALLELINIDACPTNEFCDLAAKKQIPVRFRYYLTGALGVGKSTAINHFRNLIALDEWLEPRPAILSKDWKELTKKEREGADHWILNQFKLKNAALRHEDEGIFILDRGPLDPLAFTPKTSWRTKASMIREIICEETFEIQDGQVILLHGDHEELGLRMILTQRTGYTPKKLQTMESSLLKAYGSKAVCLLDTRGFSPSEVAKRIGEIIHMDDYSKVLDINKRLAQIATKGCNVK